MALRSLHQYKHKLVSTNINSGADGCGQQNFHENDSKENDEGRVRKWDGNVKKRTRGMSPNDPMSRSNEGRINKVLR